MVARREHREERADLRRHAAGEGHRADTALQIGDALLEGRDRRVHDATIDVAVLLEVEVRRRALGILKGEGRALIQRRHARPRVGVRAMPGVNGSRLEAKLPQRVVATLWTRRTRAILTRHLADLSRCICQSLKSRARPVSPLQNQSTSVEDGSGNTRL